MFNRKQEAGYKKQEKTLVIAVYEAIANSANPLCFRAIASYLAMTQFVVLSFFFSPDSR
jgi:hypothetical protein